MKKPNRILLVVAIIIVVSFCACKPPIVPPPDASDSGPLLGDASSSSAAACANLAALGCAEGTSANCVPVLDHVIAAQLTTVDLGCMTAAKSKADARKCPGVACP